MASNHSLQRAFKASRESALMLANVSFGILAFHPIGWSLMLAVIAVEAVMLRRFSGADAATSRMFLVSAVANGVSGAVGLAVSLWLNGGWWLVVWVPWVTANEVVRSQWPELAVYMAIAFALSVAIETAVTKAMLPNISPGRVAAVVATMNLMTSLLLMAVFWSLGGVPGTRDSLLWLIGANDLLAGTR
jgi:hypothetical protein